MDKVRIFCNHSMTLSRYYLIPGPGAIFVDSEFVVWCFDPGHELAISYILVNTGVPPLVRSPLLSTIFTNTNFQKYKLITTRHIF